MHLRLMHSQATVRSFAHWTLAFARPFWWWFLNDGPLRDFPFPSVDHLDRVLAGCCWEVHATRADPEESLSSLRQVSKRLTMLLAGYLAKEVAAILREILTHPTKKLYDCSNYWLQPIYQELLHSSSRYNATRNGEKNRPSNGLARISAHSRPPKKLKPAASGTRFTDWIGGVCYADTLQVWFPAHYWYCTSCSIRRMSTELPTPLGWTRMMFLMIFESSGRRHGPIGLCSSRWVTSKIATSVC